jgi:hypothetical protein
LAQAEKLANFRNVEVIKEALQVLSEPDLIDRNFVNQADFL